MKKSSTILICLFTLILTHLSADQQLSLLIKDKDFSKISSLFSDNSYLVLRPYFKKYNRIGFNYKKAGQTMFYVKFNDYAEIGLLIYQKEHNQYKGLILKRVIRPLYFVNKFIQYNIKNQAIKIGDASIFFEEGSIFRIHPFDSLFLFSGSWKFQIQPSDEEERQTLNFLFKSTTFKAEKRVGLFRLENTEFLKTIEPSGETYTLGDPDILMILDMLKKEYGIPIEPLNEHWYLSFSQNLNFVFFRNLKNNFFKYYYNQNLSPDTILLSSPENKYVLSYNLHKTLKFGSASNDQLEHIKLNLYFNPKTLFLSGSSILEFSSSTDLKKINLDNRLNIKGFQTPDNRKINLLKNNNQYFIMGQDLKKVSLYYSGQVTNDNPGKDIFEDPLSHHYGKSIDHFYTMGKNQIFFPKSGDNFFKSSLSISLPGSLNCMASGQLIKKERVQNRHIFRFESQGSRDLAVIYGNFKKIQTLPAKIPLNLYGSKNFLIKDYFKMEDIKRYVNFLIDVFGDPNLGELNILFRRWKDFGGTSHNGFIIFNLANPYNPWFKSKRRRILRDSPVVVSKYINRDNFIHELSHQWWGELMSWKTFTRIYNVQEGFFKFD